MKKFLIMVAMLAMSTGAYAAGGKVNNPWQPIDPDTDVCTAFLPQGIDVSDCLELASTSSGITYLCGSLSDYVVMCPDSVSDIGSNEGSGDGNDDQDD